MRTNYGSITTKYMYKYCEATTLKASNVAGKKRRINKKQNKYKYISGFKRKNRDPDIVLHTKEGMG